MGQRILKVTPELIAAALKLPETCRIVDVVRDEADYLYLDRTTLAIKLESPDFGPVEPGCVIPQVHATYCTSNGVFEFNGWWPRPEPLMPTECAPFNCDGATVTILIDDKVFEFDSSGVGIPAAEFNAEPPPLPEPEPKKIKFREFL